MEKKKDLKYAHNPNYCMILPSTDEEEEDDIVTGNQS